MRAALKGERQEKERYVLEKKVILIIETNESLAQLYATRVEIMGASEFDPITAITVVEARDRFHSLLPRLAAVITAGRLGNGVRAAYELVREFRMADFQGPVVANSSNNTMNEELQKAGADFVSPEKSRAVETCLNALDALFPQ